MHKVIFTSLLFLISPVCNGHTSDVGLIQNLFHQVTGLEHVMILVAIGVLTIGKSTHDRYLMPFLFITALSAGSLLSLQASTTLVVEKSFLFSVLFLGTLLFARKEAVNILSKVVFTLFSLTYGLAHGIVSRMEYGLVNDVVNQSFYKASFFSSSSLLALVIILAFSHDSIRYIKGQMAMGYVMAFCCSVFLLNQ